MSADALKQRIRLEIGEPSDEASLTTIGRLREWVYLHTAVSATAGTLLPPQLLEGDLAAVIEKQEDTQGGYWCAGVETILRRIYALFGIEAAGFFYGVDGVYSHVTTLVPWNGDWIVQDAYFNAQWTDDAGTPLPILQAFENLKRRELFQAESGSLTRTVLFEGEVESDHWVAAKIEPGSTVRRDDGGYACRAVTDMASFQQSWTFRDKAVQFLREAGLPDDFRYFALFPQAVSVSGVYFDDPARNKLLRRLREETAGVHFLPTDGESPQ